MASIVETFSQADFEMLAAVDGRSPDQLRVELGHRPWLIHELLSDPDLLGRLLDPDSSIELITPFFLFSVLAHRAAAELRDLEYVNDWWGPSQRLPVFDVDPLREFVSESNRVFYLARLLASFATPERLPVKGPLDMSGMALWLDQLMPTERVQMLRRLGDLALFLTGVFPDRTGARPLSPSAARLLGETVHMKADEILALCDDTNPFSGLDALESLGSRWYEAAVNESGVSRSVPAVVADVATRFSAARRVLNHLTDRYLYRFETRWDPAA